MSELNVISVYLVACAFVVLDYVTGLCKAWATKSFSSSVMRAGLWHKIALLLAMCIGWLADYAQRVVDIGLSAPVGGAVCVYIILMELVSSLENLHAINPEIMPRMFGALFGSVSREGGEGDAKNGG